MERSQEPFCVEIYRKNAGPQSRKRHFVWKFTGKRPEPNPEKAILCGNVREKCQTQIPRPAFCMSLSSRNAHGNFTRAILRRINLQEKCRAPIPGSTLCARLRSRNAHGHFTCKTQFVWKLQEKSRTLRRPPRLYKHRALYSYRKNPFSVATLFREKV